MFAISASHMARIHSEVAVNAVDALLTEVRESATACVAHADDNALRAALGKALHSAATLGWRARGSVRLYAELALQFGCQFASDPFHSWFPAALSRATGMAEVEQATACHAALAAHWLRVTGTDGKRQLRALERLASFDPLRAFAAGAPIGARVADVLQALYAGLWTTSPDTTRHWLCQTAAERVAQGMPGALSGQLACLQFYLGHAVLRDPLHPWVRQAFQTHVPGTEQSALLRDAVRAYAAQRLSACGVAADEPVSAGVSTLRLQPTQRAVEQSIPGGTASLPAFARMPTAPTHTEGAQMPAVETVIGVPSVGPYPFDLSLLSDAAKQALRNYQFEPPAQGAMAKRLAPELAKLNRSAFLAKMDALVGPTCVREARELNRPWKAGKQTLIKYSFADGTLVRYREFGDIYLSPSAEFAVPTYTIAVKADPTGPDDGLAGNDVIAFLVDANGAAVPARPQQLAVRDPNPQAKPPVPPAWVQRALAQDAGHRSIAT